MAGLAERIWELEQQVVVLGDELKEVKVTIMSMSNVLGGLRSVLGGTAEARVVGRPSQSVDTQPDRAKPANTFEPSEALERAEALFEALLSMKPPSLISYSGAYRRIIGPYTEWRNAIHAPEVINLALRTRPRQVGRFSIRLDALIVGQQTRRPGPGHFKAADYSIGDWIQTFGSWPLVD